MKIENDKSATLVKYTRSEELRQERKKNSRLLLHEL